MDQVKTKPEGDPFTVQSSAHTKLEEKKSSSEDVNSLNQRSTEINMECDEDSCDLTSQIRFEEVLLPNNFPMVKCEAVEESCYVETIKEEEETTDEVIAETSLNTDGDEMLQDEDTNPENALSSGNCAFGSTLDRQIYDHFLRGENLQSLSASLTDRGPYKCVACGKVVQTLHNLKTHFRTHAGEKRFKCDICGKYFSESGNLKAHVTYRVSHYGPLEMQNPCYGSSHKNSDFDVPRSKDLSQELLKIFLISVNSSKIFYTFNNYEFLY